MRKCTLACVAKGVVLAFSILLANLPGYAAPELVYQTFDPPVIKVDWTGPVVYQVKASGHPTQVVLELNSPSGRAEERKLHDDGLDGDRQAGDGVYSVSLSTAEIVRLLRPNDVFRVEVGFVVLYQGSREATQGNVFADVLTEDIPRLPVIRLVPDVQYTDYLVNIVDPEFVTATAYDIPSVTRRFYQLFPDDFDFLNLISFPSYFRNRFHFQVKNEVRGIVVRPFDHSARYGSAGRLLGITVFPMPALFDGASPGHQHELGHQWINYLHFPPLDHGNPHWPLSDLAGGLMGYSDPVTRQGLNFPFVVRPSSEGLVIEPRTEPPEFTDLDLYLMGLLPPSAVGTHAVFPPNTQASDLYALIGGLYRGPYETVSIEEIVRQAGPRIPDASKSPHRFKIATIIVSQEGLLSEETMAFYSYFARRAEETREITYHSGFAKGLTKPFYLATRGLGSLDARVTAGSQGPVITPSERFASVSFADIVALSGELSRNRIDGSERPSNQLVPGAIVIYETNEGCFGKFQVLEYGYNLTLRWVTCDRDGRVHSRGKCTIRGTFDADLNEGGGVTSAAADFLWKRVTPTERYLLPKNWARFALFLGD